MNPIWFDEAFYLTTKTDQMNKAGGSFTPAYVGALITNAGMTSYQHYTLCGDAEGLSPSAYFNRYEYLSAKAVQMNRARQDGKTDWNVDSVATALHAAGFTAAAHYSTFGWIENINPSNDFDTSTYIANKLTQIRKTPGVDSNGKTYASYETADLVASLAASGVDPLSHYRFFGPLEQLVPSPVPAEERVAPDPARHRDPILAADGKTITVHLTSPVKAASIEAADFTVVVDGVVRHVATAAAGPDTVNYDVVLTLNDSQRLPGLVGTGNPIITVVYNPDGGSTAKLETELGPVAPFAWATVNQSLCFDILERITEESVGGIGTVRTLNLSLVTPLNYVEILDVEDFVKVDLGAKEGVVSGGLFGIVTPPRLLDGALVHRLDTTNVPNSVHLDIRAGNSGSYITTGNGADLITLGNGRDVIAFSSMINSQLSHMDAIAGFSYDAGDTGDRLHFPERAVDKVQFRGPLSLEGALDEKTIQAVFGSQKMDASTAYLLQNGADHVLVVDSDANGVFEAAKDFAVALIGMKLPTELSPGDILNAMLQ